jgi:hypothetical protein
MTDPLIEIAFQGGPNETADARQLPPGSVVSSLNVSYDQEGSYGVRKGYTSLSASGPANLLKLANFNDELLGIDGQSLWSFDGEAGAWVERDNVPAMGVTHAPLQNATSSFESWGSVVANGYRVAAWTDPSISSPRVAVYSTTTGAIVQTASLSNPNGEGSSALAHLCIGLVGSTAIVTIAGAQGVYAWALNTANIAAGWSAGTTVSLGSYLGNTIYAVAFLATTFIIGHEAQTDVAGTTTSALVLHSYNAAMSPVGTGIIPVGTWNGSATYTNWYGFTAMAACGTTDPVAWFAVATTNRASGGGATDTTFVCAVNPSTLAALSSNSPPAVGMDCGQYVATRLTIGRLSATSAIVSANCGPLTGFLDGFMGPSGAALGSGTAFQELGFNSKVSGVQTLYQWYAASQPYYVPSLGTHIMLMRQPSKTVAPTTAYAAGQLFQGTYALVDLNTDTVWNTSNSLGPLPRLLKILAPRIANVPEDIGNGGMFSTPSIGAGATSTTLEVVAPIARTTSVLGLENFVIDFEADFRFTPAALGRELYIGGDFYDGGTRVVETGFSCRPSIQQVGSTSGNLTWEYTATYLRIDNAGNEEESAPSDPLQVSANSPSFSIAVTCCTLTNKQRQVDDTFGTFGGKNASYIYLVLYRTQALQNGDTLHYRVAELPLPNGNLNIVQNATVTINDSATDAAVSTATTLYTDSGELPHNCPEAATFVTAHMNRAYILGSDQRTIWASQTYAAGELPNWNESLTLTVDDTDELLVGLGSLYDRMYVFSENTIHVLWGDGPGVTGAGSSYQLPMPRVTSAVGCIDPRSIVQCPLGIAFQSARGLEVADGSGNVTFIGQPISVSTKTYPVCTSAIYCPNTSTLRFTMTNTAGTAGIVAVLDIRRQDPASPGGLPGRWAIHQLTGEAPTTAAPYAGAALTASCYHPVYGYVTAYQGGANGLTVTYRENTTDDPAPWLDVGASGSYFVPLIVTSSWLKAGDFVTGWGAVRRIRALCTYYDAHGLTATIGYDYIPGTEVHAFSSQVVGSFVNGSQEFVKYAPVNSQCAALQVTLQTVAPIAPQVAKTGQGASFVGLSLEVHPRRGGWRRGGALGQS